MGAPSNLLRITPVSPRGSGDGVVESVTLARTGHPAEALPAEEEAVAIRRELAAASPDP